VTDTEDPTLCADCGHEPEAHIAETGDCLRVTCRCTAFVPRARDAQPARLSGGAS
jgi:hypothetical protein